ncbi:MAG TPA: AAA family ATPase [Candidatus Kapabacteria bacterium]|nr:AAA family ATPase [Candidatus Kapabacteria bacterium]
MKEKIVIKNFSVLDDVYLEINKINILIGPQATGKSLIAKLIYFFKSYVITDMVFAIISNQERRKLDAVLKERFNSLFPGYLINRNSFEIHYYYGENWISISNEKDKNFKSMEISYSDNILNGFSQIKKSYNKKKKAIPIDLTIKQQWDVETSDELSRLFYGENRYTYFIPALRSIFFQIEKQIFSLLANRYPAIDFFLSIFGDFFQQIKNRYQNTPIPGGISPDLYQLCCEALGGKFKYDGTNDWITVPGNRSVLLKNSSSGQQELTPMLLALQELSTYSNYAFTFIEEPEAHIFPETQYKIVEVIASVYNIRKRNTGFFITTHSPYILTAFNNLIQAENTYRDIKKRFDSKEINDSLKEDLIKKLADTINQGRWVAFDDVAVYLIEGGKCWDIKDSEAKLIDADAIDKVSDTAASIFNRLLDISCGD